MSTWANAAHTQKGLALQAKLLSGHTLTITKVMTSTGYVEPSALTDQTDLGGTKKQTLTIKSRTYPSPGKCNIDVALTNDGVSEAYTAKQVGFFATDPDEGEILYLIAQDTKGTEVPSQNDTPSYSAGWKFTLEYGQADSVTVTVDPANTVSRQELEEELEKLSAKAYTTSGTNTAYTVSVPGVTELYVGLSLMIVPHTTSNSTTPTLDVNGLGAVGIRDQLASTYQTCIPGSRANWLRQGKPVSVTYDGTFWRTNVARASSESFYGVMDIDKGGTGASTAEGARENLEVAQAIEDDTHKGCYYRLVGGEKEWINPPLVSGSDYRTTERIDGKTVYIRSEKFILAASGSKEISLGTGTMVWDITIKRQNLANEWKNLSDSEATVTIDGTTVSGCFVQFSNISPNTAISCISIIKYLK